MLELVCCVKSCAKQVSEHSEAAAPQVELGSMLTGTQCPNQSPARPKNNLAAREERGRDGVSDGGEEGRQMKAGKRRRAGENTGMRFED